MTIAGRLAPLGLLTALALTYFGALVIHPSHTLYADHSDLIALHVPWETFLARAWRETGELPLWNPLQFAGLPFVHDVQAAISYPPHAIFRWVGESNVGQALSWLIVVHVILAGWGMFAYARATGLGPTAAVVSALGLMFAGKWLLHLTLAGHYAFVGLAWLPWTLLGLDRALRHRSPIDAIWAGVAFAMLTLSTHPQLTLYSGLFLVIWTFPFVLDADLFPPPQPSPIGGEGGLVGQSKLWFPPPLWGRVRVGGHSEQIKTVSLLIRFALWIGFGLITATVALALASVQLLPALESTRFASRGVSGLPESPSLSLRTLLRTFGPSPEGVQPVISWEPRSGLGVIGIALAWVALVVTTGPARRRAQWGLWTVIGMTAFALGGAVIFHSLPLFRMFRQPSRMFLVAALPLADLSGLVTQAFIDGGERSTRENHKARRVFALVSLLMIAGLTMTALSSGVHSLRPHPYWFSLLATVPLAWWLIGAKTDRIAWRVGWVVVILIDLVAQTYCHVRTCDLREILTPSASARHVAEHSGRLDRVLDRHIPGDQSGTPLGPAVATNLGLHQVRGYNPLDLVRTKEYFTFVSAPIHIGHPYNGLINAPIYHKSLLDLLGVRFLVQPAGPDQRSTPGEPDPDRDPRWRKALVDSSPSAFSFARGGVRRMPPFEVLENLDTFPRAFVVPTVARLPDDRDAIVRAMTSTDFRQVALVESPEPLGLEGGAGQGSFRPASIRSYQPNRIEIDADGPGLLVVTDPWYPGWLASIDGQPTPIHRADYLFRGLALSGGHHAVALNFEPRSYALGRLISGGAWITVLILTAIGFVRRRGISTPPNRSNGL